MYFISTKELSKRWHISETRIVCLAKAGRIPGAQLVGKSWVFPPDTEKPADKRRKVNRVEAQTTFRFPLYLYFDYSEDEIKRSFTPDERTLYQSERLFFNGEYNKCHGLLKTLTESTADRYVRFGALYHLCLVNVYLGHNGSALYNYNEIHSLYMSETLHRNEIGFIIRNLETYFIGNNYYIEDFSIGLQTHYPPHMREYLLLECAYSDMLRAQDKSVPVNPDPYEILLDSDSDRFSPLASLTMHLYIGAICRSCGRNERSVFHISEACRIAREYDLEYSSVSFMSKYLSDTYKRALQDLNPDQLVRLNDISDEMFEAFHDQFDFIGKNSLLHILNSTDCALISFAIKNMTNKEIASILKLSMNTISKKYSILLEKTGKHSKKELAEWYLKMTKYY